jgi:hypothetical protein
VKRRDLLKTAVVGASALAARDITFARGAGARRAPPSDRIQVGMIRVASFGLGANLPDFMKNPDVDVAAICDVYQANPKG